MSQQFKFNAWNNLIESNSMCICSTTFETKWTKLQKMLFYSILFKINTRLLWTPTTSGSPIKKYNQQTSLQKIFFNSRQYLFIFHSVYVSIPPFSSLCNLFIIFLEDGFKQDTDKKSCLSLYLLPMGKPPGLIIQVVSFFNISWLS